MYEDKNIEPEFLKRPKKNPFRTPDHYFDTIEDRIMGNIKYQAKKKTSSTKVIQFLKPVLGLVASFSLVYLLVYYPINHLLPKTLVKSAITDTTSPYLTDDSTLNFSLIDENAVVNAIFSDETSNIAEINSDEMLAYLSSGMNEVEIYSEIQN
jgi:hypothetical protein